MRVCDSIKPKNVILVPNAYKIQMADLINWSNPDTLIPCITLNKARTGPRSAARFKPEVHPRSKLTKCPEEEQLNQLLGTSAIGRRQK